MDRRDERCQRMDQIYEHLNSAYCQFSSSSQSECFSSHKGEREDVGTPQDMEKGLLPYPVQVFQFLSEFNDMISYIILFLFFSQGNEPRNSMAACSS